MLNNQEDVLFERLNRRSHSVLKSLRLSKKRANAKDLFESSIGDLINLQCFVCSSSNFKVVSSYDRYGFQYPTGLCDCCGNLQQTKYYHDKDLVNFYSNFYRDIYDGRSPSELSTFQYSTFGPKIYDFLVQNGVGINNNVLEVGCGAGGILHFLQSKGFDVLGMDFDDLHLTFARTQKVPVRLGGLEQLCGNERFDIIILNHVLEHIVDPVEFLKSVSKHLTQRGKILIEVPLLEDLKIGAYDHDFTKFFQNAHTCHFSHETLAAIGLNASLKVAADSGNGLKLFEIVANDADRAAPHFGTLRSRQIELMIEIEKRRKSASAAARRVFSLSKRFAVLLLGWLGILQLLIKFRNRFRKV